MTRVPQLLLGGCVESVLPAALTGKSLTRIAQKKQSAAKSEEIAGLGHHACVQEALGPLKALHNSAWLPILNLSAAAI